MKKFLTLTVFSALLAATTPALAQSGTATQDPLEAARKAQELEQQRRQSVDAEQLQKAMRDAQSNQSALQNSAAQLEQDSGVMTEGKEWNKKQQEDYQKALMEVTRQQKALEEESRKEMEKAKHR